MTRNSTYLEDEDGQTGSSPSPEKEPSQRDRTDGRTNRSNSLGRDRPNNKRQRTEVDYDSDESTMGPGESAMGLGPRKRMYVPNTFTYNADIKEGIC
jgi:hypothetical protein